MPGMSFGPLRGAAPTPQGGQIGNIFGNAWGNQGGAPQAGNIFGNSWGNQGQPRLPPGMQMPMNMMGMDPRAQQGPRQVPQRPQQRRRPQQRYGGGGGVNWINQNPLMGFFQRIGWGG